MAMESNSLRLGWWGDRLSFLVDDRYGGLCQGIGWAEGMIGDFFFWLVMYLVNCISRERVGRDDR